MNYLNIYNQKLCNLTQALNIIHSGDVIVTSLYANEPSTFLENLHTIADRVENVSLWVAPRMGEYQVLQDNSLIGKIDIISFFYNPDCRKGHSCGRFTFVPNTLQSVANTVIQTKRPTVFVAAASSMDSNGYFHISWDMEISAEMLEIADTIIIEENPMIVPSDTGCKIHIKDVAAVFQAPRAMNCLPEVLVDDVDLRIAENTASLINNGDTIQLGFGAVPNIVGQLLDDKKDLGIYTEIFTSSMGQLLQNGVVTNEKKNIDKGKSVCAFLCGNQDLYNIVAARKDIIVKPCAYINNPYNIASNDNMVSVNAALQIDLTGQICSETINGKQFSGTGGATDFAIGAFYSKGGKGIIAMHSTTKDGRISKIQPFLSFGSVVSIQRNFADYVITEYGIAKLKYRSVRQRVDALIAIAHPDFRSELKKEADRLMIW